MPTCEGTRPTRHMANGVRAHSSVHVSREIRRSAAVLDPARRISNAGSSIKGLCPRLDSPLSPASRQSRLCSIAIRRGDAAIIRRFFFCIFLIVILGRRFVRDYANGTVAGCLFAERLERSMTLVCWTRASCSFLVARNGEPDAEARRLNRFGEHG